MSTSTLNASNQISLMLIWPKPQCHMFATKKSLQCTMFNPGLSIHIFLHLRYPQDFFFPKDFQHQFTNSANKVPKSIKKPIGCVSLLRCNFKDLFIY